MNENRRISRSAGSANARNSSVSLDERNARYARSYRVVKRHRKILTVLSCIVAVAIFTALMLPAVAMSKGQLTCGIEDHAHADACYAQVLTCGQEESQGHAHTDACYEQVLACGQEEGEDHAHTDACYESQLACGHEESDGHTHTDACYESQLTCGKPEHTHTDACYSHEQATASNEAASSSASASSAAASASSSASTSSNSSASASASSNAAASASSSAAVKMPAAEFEKKLERTDEPDVKVSVKAPEGALPEGTTMEAKLIPADDVKTKVEEAIERENNEQAKIKSLTAVDITFKDKAGNEIEPTKAVQVKITSDDVREFDDPVLVHVLDKSKDSSKDNPHDAEVVEKVKIVNEDDDDKTVGAEDTLKFESKAFSPYVIVEYELVEGASEHNFTASDGSSYTITVNIPADAGIPANAALQVQELVKHSRAWTTYADAVEEQFGGEVDFIRLFDIKIVDENDPTITYQPAAGSAVDVKIELADAESDNLSVVHFADGDKTGDVIDSVEVESGAVSFETTGFSVYAIVDGPEPADIGWNRVTSLDDLEGQVVCIGHVNGYYFKSTTETTSDRRVGIAKTSQNKVNPTGDAAKYRFEKAAGSQNQYYVKCVDNGQYVYHSNGSDIAKKSLSFTENEDEKTAFTVAIDSNGQFTLSDGGWYWNMQGGETGNRFCSWNSGTDTNSKMYVWYYEGVEEDPYNLGGKTVAFLVWDGGKTGKALSNEAQLGSNLGAEFLTVMTKTDGDEGDELYRLFVPNNTSSNLQSTNWTFEWSEESDLYYLSSVTDDGVRYLKIDSSGLSVTADKTNANLVKVVPGTGIHGIEGQRQVCLKSADSSATLTYSGKFEEGFNVSGAVGSEWLYLAESTPESILDDGDYGRTYSAEMLSVSDAVGYQTKDYKRDDPEVMEDYSYILYTRAWNGHGYSYFALSGSGKLIPCVESGDYIEWIGGSLNDMVWQFTEYGSYDDNSDWKPSGYYELFNESSNDGAGAFLAPLVTEDQVFSNNPIGVILPGRDNGQYYSKILSWDDPGYAFSGLKVNFNDGAPEQDPTIEPCIRNDALDFYFARMKELPKDDELTPIEDTVDNNQFGISMKLKDFDSREQMSDFFGNDDYHSVTTKTVPGLLSTNLVGEGENAYPTATKTDYQLASFFSGAEEVNHLFLKSTYDSTGYFEYDSAQNFASLKGSTSGDFTVYKELGSYDSGGNKFTLKHGQFFPYNDINAGVFASVNGRNLYEPAADSQGKPVPLQDDNPRKNEQLYLIDDVNCFFGMELTASFEQTPSGLDAWGHDIIFEFSGDDDFWLYVDGELVIDLGRGHSAVPGSVNFRTGEVNVNGNTSKNLRDYFESNYRGRNPGATDQDVADYLAKYFDEGSTVFRDGTHHTMRIFYLERGAGASNLHMRFNLAAVKKGTVQLSKELEGADLSESSLLMFPYQIWYTLEGDSTPRMLTNAVPKTALTDDYVFYKDTNKAVDFRQSITVDDVEYENVFLLKPGETADVNFPVVGPFGEEQTIDTYQIIECGVDNSVYNEVSVKEDTVAEASAGSSTNPNLKNYGIGYATTDERPKVTYVNKTNAIESLTIVKEIYDWKTHEKINPYNEDGSVKPEYEDSEILKTPFAFRLDFKTVFDDDFVAANMHVYHVKNPAGHYCKWDKSNQQFVPIMHGTVPVDNYDDLYDDEKIAASFDTSMYGSITKIPAYYTVELRGLIPGMEYRVTERPGEIPDGYDFWKYMLNGEDKTEPDPDYGYHVTGVISLDEKADVTVCNFKGYGLRVNKIWADEESTEDRDPAYFAVFYKTKDQEGKDVLTLVNDSVRSLAFTAKSQTQYWYYQELPNAAGVSPEDVKFENLYIYEVTLTGNPVINADGTVSGYTGVTPVADGDTIVMEGTPTGGERQSLSYKVTYDNPTVIDDEEHANPTHVGDNVGIFYATNTPDNRPVIKLQKSDWSGAPLSGAVFELTDADDTLIGTYTSNASGLIRTAYLDYGKSYTLTETQSPQGYVGLSQSLTITMPEQDAADPQVKVSPAPADVDDYYTLALQTDEEPATLTVKDRPYVFQAVKVNAKSTTEKVAGAQFQLWKQVSVGETQNWTVLEWEDAVADEKSRLTILVSRDDGTIPHLDSALPAGLYQLREVAAPNGYERISADIDFTISPLGEISLGETHPGDVTIDTSVDEQTGAVTYLLSIPNEPLTSVMLKKVDELGQPKTGSQFKLETLNGEVWSPVPGYNPIDMTNASQAELALLPAGRYRLTETKAPDGYVIMTKYVYFTIAQDRTVKLTDEAGTGDNDNEKASITGPVDGVYTITVENTPGKELPKTGGTGTAPYTLGGIFLVVAAAFVYVFGLKRRQTQ